LVGLELALALALAAVLPSSHAQQPPKVYRMGYLTNVFLPSDRTPNNCPAKGKGSRYWQALLEGLRDRGYVQDENLVIVCRSTEGQDERAPALAAELVSLKVDIVVAATRQNVRAAKQATSTIPIVMVGVVSPVQSGIIDSLARPVGNVTGLAEDTGRDIEGKWLQLLKEVKPNASRVAVLDYSFNNPPETSIVPELVAAAKALNVTLQPYAVREPQELEDTFAAITKGRADALLVLPAPFMGVHRQRIVDLAARIRLPAVYPYRDHVEAGGLLAYDIDRLGIWRRIGYYVDRILKGAKPADLPVEQPTKFDLVINLKTAKALGITIPQSLRMQADQIIE
jgi:putative ABC transport system substrate-binding protein